MKIQIQECPILHPTYQQFKFFSKYVQKVEKEYRDSYGIVKIVPPPEWISRTKNYKKILTNLTIKKPEYQSLYGDPRGYYFNCQNAFHSAMSFSQYKDYALTKETEIQQYKSTENIQQYFWNIYTGLRNQIYCPNLEVTLMDETSGQWEFEKLNSFFNQAIKEKLLGLNTSFLFIGSWKTFFNWHIEDLDLSAINLLHEGATKMWYGIHPQDRKKYESILKDLFPEENIKCSNFYRHKQIFLNPYKLKQKYPYLRISKMFQNQGEISLAFANGYHCGFNMGFNVAEAVNYGTIDWLQRFCQFKKCKCPAKIGVEIENQEIVKNLKQSQIYDTVKNNQALAKIMQKAKQEIEADERFRKDTDKQKEVEVQKERMRPCNKGKQMVFVPIYKRYFPVQKETNFHIQCNSCGRWRKVSEKKSKMYSEKRFECPMIKLKCKAPKKKQQGQVKAQKSKKIQKASKV